MTSMSSPTGSCRAVAAARRGWSMVAAEVSQVPCSLDTGRVKELTPVPRGGHRVRDPFDPSSSRTRSPRSRSCGARTRCTTSPSTTGTWSRAMDLIREALRQPELYANIARPSARRTDPPAEIAAEVAAIRAKAFPVRAGAEPQRPAGAHPLPPAGQPCVHAAGAGPDGADGRSGRARTRGRARPTARARRHRRRAGAAAAGLRDRAHPRARDERRDDMVRWSDAATAGLGRGSRARGVAGGRAGQPRLPAGRCPPSSTIAAATAARTCSARWSRRPRTTEPLGNGELVWLVARLLVAGNETTTRSLAEAIVHLDEHPEYWACLREDHELCAEQVAEEAIRLSSPAMGMFRRATEDTVLGGTPLPQGRARLPRLRRRQPRPGLFDEPDEFRRDVRTRATTSRSGTASTCASAPGWRAWRRRSRCGRWPTR